MDLLKPEYETYQDVKNTLAWWAAPIWGIFAIVMFYVVLTPAHRQTVLVLVLLLGEIWGHAGAVTILIVLGAVFSYIAVHILELHDHVYDQYFVKWRRDYARDQIVPALVTPYAESFPTRLLEVAKEDLRKTLNLIFYPFVGDRDTKIRKNLVVRFYERITKYWLAQLAEIACLLFITGVVLYCAAGFVVEWWAKGSGWTISFLAFLTIVPALLLFALVRIISKRLRKAVWEATHEEILDIHSQCAEALQEALKKLCMEYGIDEESP